MDCLNHDLPRPKSKDFPAKETQDEAAPEKMQQIGAEKDSPVKVEKSSTAAVQIAQQLTIDSLSRPLMLKVFQHLTIIERLRVESGRLPSKWT